ncbi:endo-1,4-beta-xylanase [Cellulomonas hominis]
MRRTRSVTRVAAGLLATSVVAAGLVGPSIGAAVAAPAPVLSVDFDDGTTGALIRSGSPTLDVIDGGVAGKALRVSDRVNSWDTAQTPTGLLDAGTTYTLSAALRLVEGTEGTRTAHFTVDDGSYVWVGTTSVSADAWSTVTGTYTPPAAADPATVKASIEAEAVAGGPLPAFLLDDVVITAVDSGPAPTEPGPAPGTQVLASDFEDDLDGWAPRVAGSGAPVLERTTEDAHTGTGAAALTARSSQGDGIGHDVTGLLVPGTTYELSAWLRFAPGQPTDGIWLSMARTLGGSTSYDTLDQYTEVSADGWAHVTTRFQMGRADAALIYLETAYRSGATGNTSDFLLDDVSISVPAQAQVQDLTPIKDTVPFPVGVAVDSRETTGAAAELLQQHFDQVTPENYMKPEAWYNAAREFAPGPETDALMVFGQENDVRVYGHTLVWHSQTPAWFFQDDAGAPLTTSPADQQLLRDRMRTHIFAVAAYLADSYGAFGSATNPLHAFDVVNEVVSDAADTSDGLRRSEWYRILGEDYIDLAFEYANEAFNSTYAAPGVDRPITLFINDYNTEQPGKQQRLRALVERLLARGVPVDGVGHQFHVSLSTAVSALEGALVAFEDLPVTQAVTELDVTTGTPVNAARLTDQGYFYRDAFRVFRAHADSLFSVTVWGLTDGRSWRVGSGAPLLFDDELQAKPAYHGVVDGDLGARQRAANVFRGDVPLDDRATTALAWRQLPLHDIEGTAAFQLRWETDHLTAYVRVTDADAEAGDGVELAYGGSTVRIARDGTGDAPAVASEVDGGYALVVHLPVVAAQGGTLPFDVQVTDGSSTSAWSTPGTTGTLSFLEPLSYLEVPEAADAPAIDGDVDAAWADVPAVRTATQVEGTGGAVADVRTMWREGVLYVLATVTDPDVDVSGSDPWTQDSVELFVDAGNHKNGSYRYDDTQIRISAANALSFGTGDEPFQRARVTSATARTPDGYVVEAGVSLLEEGGADTFHGLDFQVNDASSGARRAVHTWAEPTGTGYQTTARWGVGRLVPQDVDTPTPDVPGIALSAGTVRAGGELTASLTGFTAGTAVDLVLQDARPQRALLRPVAVLAASHAVLGTVTIGAGPVTTARMQVPAATAAGPYTLAAVDGDVVLASAPLTVLAADVVPPPAPPTPPVAPVPPAPASPAGNGSGVLASTGAQIGAAALVAAALLAAGAVLVVRRRRDAAVMADGDQAGEESGATA